VITAIYDVAVVGAGAAGMMAALAAGDMRTVLLTDGPIGRSNTVMAQGGLQLPHDTDESRMSLVADMIRSARVPVDGERIERFVDEIRPTIALLERWGLRLTRGEDGTVVRRIAGGMSEPRVAGAGDDLGRSLVKVLRRTIEESPVEVRTGMGVTGIEPGPSSLSLRLSGTSNPVVARCVVVATGGRTSAVAVERGERTTNPPNHNDVMHDIVAALGVPTIHDDVFQYQPFGMVDVAGPYGRCVPESVVGFDVRLLDRGGVELCPVRQDRLALTRAMIAGEREGRAASRPAGPGFRLTLSDIPDATLERVFPKLAATLRRHGTDGGDVWVWPFLHYQLGGFAVGRDGTTDIPGLFLTGEMAGGLHGLNRLMGNGITDSLVNGRLAGLAAARLAASR
jgi:succinate dehydrogenase/fumarate reductase flavoprotein subunit